MPSRSQVNANKSKMPRAKSGFQQGGSYVPQYESRVGKVRQRTRNKLSKNGPGRGLFMVLAKGWNNFVSIVAVVVLLIFIYVLLT